MRLRELREISYWHGTDIPDLEQLEPKWSELLGRDAVFAATHPEVAVAMANHWTDEDFNFGRNVSSRQDPNKVPYTLQELWDGAIDEFIKGPIYLYEVDHKDFFSNGKLQDFEVVSYKPVKIIGHKEISEPLSYLEESKMVRVQRFGQ
jgi:hypothetical protein